MIRYRVLALTLAAGLPVCAAAQLEDSGETPPLRGFTRQKLKKPEERRDKPRTALKRSGGFDSIHSLLPRAFTMARQWSPNAALYSLIGRAPRNEKMLEPEEWSFTFGDPKTRDGRFSVTFKNQTIESREGIKAGVQMTELFRDGNFDKRLSHRMDWESNDYRDCRPVVHNFIDTLDVEKIIREQGLLAGKLNQYRVTLLNPLNDNCDGLGYLSQFLTEKPIPLKLQKRTLWIVTNDSETLFINAVSAAVLLRRYRKEDEASETGTPEPPPAAAQKPPPETIRRPPPPDKRHPPPPPDPY